MVKYCPNCGSANDDNATSCAYCGSSLPFERKDNRTSQPQGDQTSLIPNLFTIPQLYRDWYKKNHVGLLTEFLLILLFIILFLGPLGVLSQFIAFQIVFFILFLIVTYYLGIVASGKTIVILFILTFLVLGPLTILGITINYENMEIILPKHVNIISILIYFIQLIMASIVVATGIYDKPLMKISLRSEKNLQRLILDWNNYSKEKLNQYFYPIKCKLLSEGTYKDWLEKEKVDYGSYDKPLLKVRKDPYEAIAGFDLKYKGIEAYLVLELHSKNVGVQNFGYYIVEVTYDIYLPVNRKLTNTRFIQNYISNIFRGVDNFIYANMRDTVT
ncbi:zinc ribbon domain-containing protein [Stygiolobus caldivivus]|uniref:Zinc-ribbon domain-containing protein n=1 Tax=Stygiolobus caldivivus TaxID=2824673 RepID=A0A8D5U662_9CREN|nr:zinc ribbon domain-containing protein [Stygiolobus caldivivus]BCU69576.1 hypothetical protein KN1_08730 [Stygiolobus caldivivus]